MSKRITITYTNDVSSQEAVTMVKYVIDNNIEKGECITFNNDLAVDMANNTKFPSYYIWRVKKKQVVRKMLLGHSSEKAFVRYICYDEDS